MLPKCWIVLIFWVFKKSAIRQFYFPSSFATLTASYDIVENSRSISRFFLIYSLQRPLSFSSKCSGRSVLNFFNWLIILPNTLMRKFSVPYEDWTLIYSNKFCSSSDDSSSFSSLSVSIYFSTSSSTSSSSMSSSSLELSSGSSTSLSSSETCVS